MSWLRLTVVTTCGIFILGLAYFYYLLSPTMITAGEESFIINAGAGLKEIVSLLDGLGFIRSPAAFKIYSLLSGSAHKLKPGEYQLAASLSTPQLVRRLIQGPPDQEILIIEGESLKDIDKKLTSSGLIEAGSLASFSPPLLAGDFPFLQGVGNLEGFLFPDTYRIAPRSSVEEILKKLLANFENKALPQLRVSGDDWYETLIIASLIEREIPKEEDREFVAGILSKRLELGMPLQVDASVVYAKCRGSFTDCPPLTRDDFRVKSLYNTYFYPGLPPSPIANPGLGAVSAAQSPRASDFLYYLSDPKTGKTVFAETFEEHNINRARYLPRTFSR